MSNRSDWKLIEVLVVRATCGQRVVLREGSPRREMLNRALLRYVHPEWEEDEWHVKLYGVYCAKVMHATSGGMIDLAMPDMSHLHLAGSKPLGIYEVCFGCGARRKVDLEPLWQYAVIFRGVNRPISLCNECGPVVHGNMEEREDIVHMNEFEEVLDKRPWLADHTSRFMLEEAVKHWTSGIGHESVIDRSGLDL
jgi:hypothetical protein